MKDMKFGEWLKIRRLAAEMTPIDVAKKIGLELAAYKEIEADRMGVSEEILMALVKLEKLKMTERDARAKAVMIGSEGAPELAAEAPPPGFSTPSANSALDAIIRSATAQQVRRIEVTAAAKAKSGLAAYLENLRTERGLSQMDLARLCKVTPDLLEDINSGFNPGPPVIKKLADGLALPVEELLEHAKV